MEINDDSKSYLLETAKWAKFLSIIGFIGIGLIVIAGGFVSLLSSSIPTVPNFPLKFGYFGIIYLVMGVLYFFHTYYLYKFYTDLKQGLIFNEQSAVTSGFGYFKSTFKFIGILTIIVLSFYLLFIVGEIVFAGIFLHR